MDTDPVNLASYSYKARVFRLCLMPYSFIDCPLLLYVTVILGVVARVEAQLEKDNQQCLDL